MRRSKIGSIAGEGEGRITKRKNNGSLSYQLTQVRSLFFLLGNRAKFFSDPDFDPAKAARDERKAGVAKNEKQRLRNIEHSKTSHFPSKDERKKDIEKTLATSRISTASMGK